MNDSERRLTDPFRDDLHTLMEHVGAMKESLARIEEKMVRVDDHHKTLYGINGTPGLTLIVDRLDQAEKTRSRHLGVIYTALGGLAIKEFWALLMGHRGP